MYLSQCVTVINLVQTVSLSGMLSPAVASTATLHITYSATKLNLEALRHKHFVVDLVGLFEAILGQHGDLDQLVCFSSFHAVRVGHVIGGEDFPQLFH